MLCDERMPAAERAVCGLREEEAQLCRARGHGGVGARTVFSVQNVGAERCTRFLKGNVETFLRLFNRHDRRCLGETRGCQCRIHSRAGCLLLGRPVDSEPRAGRAPVLSHPLGHSHP